MRRYKNLSALVAIFMALFYVALPAGAKDDAKPVMEAKETVHNFGNIREDGGPVSCEFEFENVGKGNLVIVSATAECGCTKPEFPKQPIAPGKKGKISVTYTPLGRPGGFDKVVTVKTNGKPGKMRFKIRGTVIPKK
ncbi:MAG: DUF1573 domain-containing protein [Muribaculaceae bacterium]|nr:DUF1573 domain-containing protein [Muribaculaceae bacterium]MDE6768571.1 DUF1573 domain-containing protein [Muribaculaceae bacterium]